MSLRLLFLFQILVLGCVVAADPMVLFVSVVPQLEAVQRIGGDAVRVEALVPAGASPEYYQPDARRLVTLSRSRALLCIGAPLEKALLPKVRKNFPGVAVIDLRQGMALRQLTVGEVPEAEHDHADGHGHDHGHAAGEPDPHVWLSVKNMICHAENVIAALCMLDPAGADGYRARGRAYSDELRQLDERLQRLLAPLRGTAVMVFHPAFGYFLDAYGLEQLTVEHEGKEPGARQLAALLRLARAKRVRAIYVQPQFNERSARSLAQSLGVQVRAWDPLPDPYIAGLERMAAVLRDVQSDSK
ncbi:MAG: zinc ABC transporter substrate-binding protein [Lentisphaeria bacterium]|nr:zinc ABC transporter substrate-binding protein [Lentisphaeria bacterium]